MPETPPRPPSPDAARPGRLAEVARLFLKLGIIGFGGPAAHVALMEDEVVRRRRWLPRERFLDLLGATNLIPGPNSTEMAIHLGFLRAGWPGLLVGGACFIAPATLIVLALAGLYGRYGALPEAGSLLYGVKPVMIVIVAQALVALARRAAGTPLTAAVALIVLALSVAGVNEIALLFGAALACALVRGAGARGRPRLLGLGAPSLIALAGPAVPATAGSAAGVSLIGLGLTFLKVGSILFGSGYVLLAFLRPELVERTGWLSDAQLLDAIAVGQVTPGPVLTTATFIGYVLAGVPGALVATAGIFLPSFVLVAVTAPHVARLRRSPWSGGFLDGANAASIALLAVVGWQLGRAAIVDALTVALAVAAGVAVLTTRVNSAWLVAAGAVVGLLGAALR